MADWALWAIETNDGDDETVEPEPAEVDETLEARRLSRWLKAMFGGSKEPREPDDS